MVTITTKVQPLDEIIQIFINDTISPEAQSAAFADFAREQLSEVEDTDQFIFGRVPPHDTIVDGREGASEDSVSPHGTIVYDFKLVSDVLVYIADQLELHSPVGSGQDKHPGLYQHHHVLFADGTEVKVDENVPDAQQYIFVNVEPYARKIEKGYSKQFPDGVYESVATIAKQQYSKIAKIEFGYTSIEGGQTDLAQWASTKRRRKTTTAAQATRQPSITVTLK